MINRKVLIAVAVILISAGSLIRIWNIDRQDMQTDDATYSFRSIGYFDYIASENKQSTPVSWFAQEQWWQPLSFHDAPPLVFATQWAFFQTGGNSNLMARLPFALMGILSIIAIFFLGQTFENETVGLIAASSLAIMNYHIWISRIGYLESFLVLWIILALNFFLRARKDENNYIWWALSLAAGILTKYSFLFLIPVFIIPLLWWRRAVWKNKKFYIAIALFLIAISPVIIYNVMMLKTRGHLDAALSTLVGMHPDDFSGLTRTKGGAINFLSTIISIAKTIAQNTSVGFSILILASLLMIGYISLQDYRQKKDAERYYFLWSGLLWATLALTVIGASDKFSVIVIPFITLCLGFGIYKIWGALKNPYKEIFIVMVLLSAVWEIFFSIQTQLMPYPMITNRFFISENRPSWKGFSELEKYVENFYQKFPDPSYVVFTKNPQIFNYQAKIINSIYDSGVEKPQQTHILIYDNRMNWFAALWIFEKRKLYDVAAISSIEQFLDAVGKNGAQQFIKYGFKDVTIITADNQDYEIADITKPLENFVKNLETTKTPDKEISDPYGKIVFRTFTLPLDDSVIKPLLLVK